MAIAIPIHSNKSINEWMNEGKTENGMECLLEKKNRHQLHLSHNQTIMVSQDPPPDTLQLAICGGGIVGLILAIGLKERLGLTADVFEACDGFVDVGAGKPSCRDLFYEDSYLL